MSNPLNTQAFEAFGWDPLNPTAPPWAEATSFRFNPLHGDASDFPRSCTNKGLGIGPDGRVTIALELLTPRTITAAYRGYLMHQQIISLRVFGAPSDALD